MEGSTAQAPGPLDELDPAAPDAIRAAAEGSRSLTVADEQDAIYWLLQPARPIRYTCDVQYDTPEGSRTLLWTIQSLPGKRIDDIESRHSAGDGPFAKIDTFASNADIVTEATVGMADKTTGTSLSLDDERFRQAPNGEVVASKVDAMRLRFHYQSGVLAYLAEEVRRISGWSPDRVGSAQRVLVDAAGN